jgi:hypothetical protein
MKYVVQRRRISSPIFSELVIVRSKTDKPISGNETNLQKKTENMIPFEAV